MEKRRIPPLRRHPSLLPRKPREAATLGKGAEEFYFHLTRVSLEYDILFLPFEFPKDKVKGVDFSLISFFHLTLCR